MFNIDFNDIAKKLIPESERGPRFIAWFKSAIRPLVQLHSQFTSFRDDINYKLLFNAQVIYLEHFLNDQYDNVNRQIYIEDTANITYNYLYNENENRPPVYLHNYSSVDYMRNENEFYETDIKLYNIPENQPYYLNSISNNQYYFYNQYEFQTQVDYIVMVPFAVNYDEQKMRRQILEYNVAGKRFNINTY